MKIIEGTEFEDLTGREFGEVRVVELIRIINEPYWRCACIKCGRETCYGSGTLYGTSAKEAICRYCLKYPSIDEVVMNRIIRRTWASMKRRCHNPKDPAYKDYGARGIYVCDEWIKSYEAFYSYVSKLDHFYEEGYSLDRIDNNDGYRPGNVRWATAKQQANNTRRNKKWRENSVIIQGQ